MQLEAIIQVEAVNQPNRTPALYVHAAVSAANAKLALEQEHTIETFAERIGQQVSEAVEAYLSSSEGQNAVREL